jgi:hypothetical protein
MVSIFAAALECAAQEAQDPIIIYARHARYEMTRRQAERYYLT